MSACEVLDTRIHHAQRPQEPICGAIGPVDEHGEPGRERGTEREQVEAMLAWPVDPEFDSRYLERSGIQDPYLLGLLD